MAAAEEAWLTGTAAPPGESARAGDCVVLNFWQADAPEVSRLTIGIDDGGVNAAFYTEADFIL